MKRYAASLKGALLITSVLGSCFAAQEVWAGSQVFDQPDTCITTNCGASPINGVYVRDQFNQAQPFILQVFSTGNECVRLDVLSQQTDLEAVLVGPDGRIWRDDDGAGSLRPLIKAITPAVRGWYTLQISSYSGTGVFSNFQLAYGRYNSSNPNCAGATVPTLTTNTLEAPKPSSDLGPLPPAGGPGKL